MFGRKIFYRKQNPLSIIRTFKLERYIWEVKKQEFSRIVLCQQLWLKTEADEIRKDKNYAG